MHIILRFSCNIEMPILFNWFSIPKPLFLPIVFEGQGVNSVVATEYMCRPHVPCLAHTRNSVLMLPYCLQLVVTFLLGEKKKKPNFMSQVCGSAEKHMVCMQETWIFDSQHHKKILFLHLYFSQCNKLPGLQLCTFFLCG